MVENGKAESAGEPTPSSASLSSASLSSSSSGAAAGAASELARAKNRPASVYTADAPTCSDCGSIMTRNGSCYKCENCGATSGCS